MSNLYIIHSPRSGSTAVFLALVHAMQPSFIPNALPPIEAGSFGSFLSANQEKLDANANLSNAFGKTEGRWRPSEGSAVFASFFGGNHPSELRSTNFLRGKRRKYEFELRKIKEIGKDFVSKNAWNSFRVLALKDADPGAKFLWVRRDIFDASESELRSRHHFGDLHRWSSASPANLATIQTKRPAIQALEMGVAYAKGIQSQFTQLEQSDIATVWFEDFLAAPVLTITQLSRTLQFVISDSFDPLSLSKRERATSRANTYAKQLEDELKFLKEEARHEASYLNYARESPNEDF